MTTGDGRQMSHAGRSWSLGASVYDGGVNFSIYSCCFRPGKSWNRQLNLVRDGRGPRAAWLISER
jgi:hypothetical protein